MDKMTYISHAMQVPHNRVVLVISDRALYYAPGCLEATDFTRYFNSAECACAWADAYPHKLDDVRDVVAIEHDKVPRGETKCWHCSLEVCNDVARSVELALGGNKP